MKPGCARSTLSANTQKKTCLSKNSKDLFRFLWVGWKQVYVERVEEHGHQQDVHAHRVDIDGQQERHGDGAGDGDGDGDCQEVGEGDGSVGDDGEDEAVEPEADGSYHQNCHCQGLHAAEKGSCHLTTTRFEWTTYLHFPIFFFSEGVRLLSVETVCWDGFIASQASL